MTENQEQEQIDDLLDADQAVAYLSEKWQMPYDKNAFRQLRFRKKIEPTRRLSTATVWSKKLLDEIEKPDRTRPRGPRRKKNEDASGESPSVL